MKKLLIILMVFSVFFSFAGCSKNSNNNGDNPIEYISDRRVQYDEAKEQYIVFFGLQDAANTYLSGTGTASISIMDETDVTLFKKDISFSSEDFTEWTNQQWDSSRYMCGLYINKSELLGSASSSGTLTLEVTLDDGTYFEGDKLYISDLPPVSVNITLPQVPTTLKVSDYFSTETIQINKLEYKSDVNYDGTATLVFDVILKLLSRTGGSSGSHSVSFGYKLRNSDGIVVDSGSVYSNPISVGETSKSSINVYNIDPRDTYTLEFDNS